MGEWATRIRDRKGKKPLRHLPWQRNEHANAKASSESTRLQSPPASSPSTSSSQGSSPYFQIPSMREPHQDTTPRSPELIHSPSSSDFVDITSPPPKKTKRLKRGRDLSQSLDHLHVSPMSARTRTRSPSHFVSTPSTSTSDNPTSPETPDCSCPICLKSIDKSVDWATPIVVEDNLGGSKATNPCAHTFCLPCIEEWAKVSNSCPLCKRIFRSLKLSSGDLIPVEDAIQPKVSYPEDLLRHEDLSNCIVCGGGDDEANLLLCDGCDLGYHTYCIDLPSIPEEDDWFCQNCERERLQQREEEWRQERLQQQREQQRQRGRRNLRRGNGGVRIESSDDEEGEGEEGSSRRGEGYKHDDFVVPDSQVDYDSENDWSDDPVETAGGRIPRKRQQRNRSTRQKVTMVISDSDSDSAGGHSTSSQCYDDLLLDETTNHDRGHAYRIPTRRKRSDAFEEVKRFMELGRYTPNN